MSDIVLVMKINFLQSEYSIDDVRQEVDKSARVSLIVSDSF